MGNSGEINWLPDPTIHNDSSLEVVIIRDNGKRIVTTESSAWQRLQRGYAVRTGGTAKWPHDVRGQWLVEGETVRIVPYDPCDEGACPECR